MLRTRAIDRDDPTWPGRSRLNFHADGVLQHDNNAGMLLRKRDDYDLLTKPTARQGEWPRREFFCWNDEGQLVAARHDRRKAVVMEQRAHQMQVWSKPFMRQRIPLIFEPRMEPFERSSTDSNNFWTWMEDIG